MSINLSHHSIFFLCYLKILYNQFKLKKCTSKVTHSLQTTHSAPRFTVHTRAATRKSTRFGRTIILSRKMLSLTKLTGQTELPSHNAGRACCLSKNHEAAPWPKAPSTALPGGLGNTHLAFSQFDTSLSPFRVKLFFGSKPLGFFLPENDAKFGNKPSTNVSVPGILAVRLVSETSIYINRKGRSSS